ncbi:MAG TPA: phage tail sheath subtilisin-like domain-containing protein [Myxococcales bacterium]|jgi:phage tail sheath protein FI|nr:phage tail sheath subtilisin-like domain-containing protein [Myxococcales bacterium]
MAPDLRTPGVYREEAFVREPEELPSGVPAFVGLGRARDGSGMESDQPQELFHLDQLAQRWIPRSGGPSWLVAAVEGFFTNQGKRCFVVPAGDPDGALLPDKDGGAARLVSAVEDKLGALADVDLVSVPDAMALPAADAQRVQRAALKHCAGAGDRFAILDGPRVAQDGDAAATLTAWRDEVLKGGEGDPSYAALYFPWIWTAGAAAPVPPGGHVAGIYSRSDAQQGTHKAPANELVAGAVDLDYLVDVPTHGNLNSAGVNCLRALPGRGLRVFGARTISRDLEWRYLNVRRVFIRLSRWIDRNMSWAPFEPNDVRLWNRISRELNAYLVGQWRAGALKGDTAAEAFQVKCDAETNPQEGREQGQVVTQISLAPAAPAEFIVVRITQRAGSTQLS